MKRSTASIARVAAFGSLRETISTARLNAGNALTQSLLRFVVLIVVLQGSEIEAESRTHQGSFAIQSAKSNSKRLDIGTTKAKAKQNTASFLWRKAGKQRLNGRIKDAKKERKAQMVRNGGRNALRLKPVFIGQQKEQIGIKGVVQR